MDQKTKDEPMDQFARLAPAFLKRGGLVLFLIMAGLLASKFLVTAEQESPSEEKILQKLDKLLNGQEEIKKELEVIKVRVTAR